MKKVVLVLGIIEGRDWNPKEGSKTLIEAHLNSHKLSTSVFPLTNSPKFNTEVTWEAGKQTIRSYKLNRVPIKVECFALDEKNNRKLLGYIVLPLTSAVEGVEADSKWYKLLGGAKGTHKTSPSILLSLHLETMTFDQYSQVNGKPLGNGTRSLEDLRMSSVLEKKRNLQGGIDLMASAQQTNGSDDYSHGQYTQYQTQNPHLMGASNGNYVGRNENIDDDIDSDIMEDDGEDDEEGELLDSEEEDCSEGDQNDDQLGMIVESYSLNEIEEDSCSVDAPAKMVTNFDNSERSSNSREKAMQNFGAQSNPVQRNISNNSADMKVDKLPKKNIENEALMKKRASAIEHLHKISETLCSRNEGKSTSDLSNANIRNASFERRILDTSNMLDLSFGQKNKRKVDSSMDTSMPNASRELNRSDREEIDLSSELKRRLSQCREATSAGVLLSQSLSETSRHSKTSHPEQRKNTSKYNASPLPKLFPKLSPKEGCIYIGPRDGELEEEFTFSVTIIYAKNLKKILPGGVIPPSAEGFQFCYSLLGYSIFTKPFHNLDDPEFAEKASAMVRSSHKSLSLYFSQHYHLHVHFMVGELCLGTSVIDVGFLIDIATKNKVKFEGVFEINSVDKSLATSDNDKHKAVVAMTFEVSKTIKCDLSIPSVSKVSSLSMEGDRESYGSRAFISDSTSSCSEHEEEMRFKNKGKTRKKRARYSVKDYLHENENLQTEREKKLILLEAAFEVEKWKEEQQKLFMKEWSAKEETLQRMLATEWSSKIKLIEEELSHRLTECDKLQEKLSNGLSELSLREETYKVKESKVKKLEQELLLEKEKLQASKLKDNRQDPENISLKQFINKQLEAEKQRNSKLENEVLKLQEDLKTSEDHLKSQTQEVISLRRKLVLTDDIIGVTKDKEILHTKIDSLQERKQYYKSQWLSALTSLHRFHSAHKRAMDEITLDANNCSPEQPSRHSPPLELSSDALKLRKLKDERTFLMGTGFYSSNHSIIRNIDKKIKELIG